MTLFQVLEYFLIYSFLGWCTEVIYQAVSKGLVVNRGFLNGPICPIYGFGVVAVFLLLENISIKEMHEVNGIAVFAGGIILATLIELIGGFVLDKMFHARWWDYSNEPFNLHGYICLKFSLIWGMAITLVVRVFHPALVDITSGIQPDTFTWALMAVLYAVYLADFIVSVLIMVGLNRRFAELDEMQARMRVVSDNLSKHLGENSLETAKKADEAKLQAHLAREDMRDKREEKQAELSRKIEEKRREIASRASAHTLFGTGRVLRAYPDLKHEEYGELLAQLQARLRKEV